MAVTGNELLWRLLLAVLGDKWSRGYIDDKGSNFKQEVSLLDSKYTKIKLDITYLVNN